MAALHKFAWLNEKAMRLLNKQSFSRLLAEEHISGLQRGEGLMALPRLNFASDGSADSSPEPTLHETCACVCPELTHAASWLRNQPQNKVKWPISSPSWRGLPFTLPTRADAKLHV